MEERGSWWKLLFDKERVAHEMLKRDDRKGYVNESKVEVGNQACFNSVICDRLCLTLAGLKSHKRKHQCQLRADCALLDLTTCNENGNVCKSAAELKQHVKIHNRKYTNIYIYTLEIFRLSSRRGTGDFIKSSCFCCC